MDQRETFHIIVSVDHSDTLSSISSFFQPNGNAPDSHAMTKCIVIVSYRSSTRIPVNDAIPLVNRTTPYSYPILSCARTRDLHIK